MTGRLKINVVEKEGEEKDRYCTFVSPDVVKRNGLPSELIVGVIDRSESAKKLSGGEVYQSFRVNREFKEMLNNFCSKFVPSQEDFIEQAKSERNGWMYVIDQRADDPAGRVPPDDVIGGFKVEQGEVVEYKPNPNYRVYSERGFTHLGDKLNRKFYDYMLSIIAGTTSRS